MRNAFIRAGLRFPDPADERAFVRAYTRGDIGWTQAAMLLGAFIYVGYTLWDWVLYPQIVPTTILIRGGVTVLALLPLTALLSTSARQWAEAIYFLYCVIPGCVLTFIYLIIPSGFAHAAAGMIIVILFVSTLLPLRIFSIVGFCVLTWVAFFVSESFATDLPSGLRFINHFEIGTAYALSIYAVGAREFQARQKFQTAQALVREKERSEQSLVELRATQAHLVQAEKLASLGQLVAGVAHEVSTPLGLALTTTTALQGDVRALTGLLSSGQVKRSDLTKGTDRLSQGLEMTAAGLQRASELLDSFKQVATDQANEEHRQIEVESWLSGLISKLAPLLSRQGLKIETNCPGGLQVDTYPGALAQVISNLALNAAVHAYPGDQSGTFAITVSQDIPSKLTIACADDGAGIPAEQSARVFDPFFTTRREKGSVGLGLHIVFNLVVSTLGGTIELANRKLGGTEFLIEIPTQLSPAANSESRGIITSSAPAAEPSGVS